MLSVFRSTESPTEELHELLGKDNASRYLFNFVLLMRDNSFKLVVSPRLMGDLTLDEFSAPKTVNHQEIWHMTDLRHLLKRGLMIWAQTPSATRLTFPHTHLYNEKRMYRFVLADNTLSLDYE